MNLQEIKEKYPQYKSIPDEELADKLYNRHYSDSMTREDFNRRVGLQAPDLGIERSGLESAQKYISGVTQEAVNTGSMGIGDRIRGLGRMAAEGLFGEGDLSKAYAQPREERMKFREEYPKSSLAAGVVGSFANPAGQKAAQIMGGAKSLAGAVGRGAATGAGLGGVQAGSEARGSLGERAAAGGVGAVMGGTIGAAAPAVVTGLAEGGKAAGRMLTQKAGQRYTNKAMRKIVQALMDDGLTIQQANQRIEALGPEAALMDVGKNSRALAGSIFRRSDRAASQIDDFLTARQEGLRDPRTGELVGGQISRINKSLDELVPQSYQATKQGLKNTNLSREFYDNAYQANQQVESPLIDRLLKTPEGKKALREAVKDVRNEMSLVSKPDPELTALAKDVEGITTGAGVGKGFKLKTLDYVKRKLQEIESGFIKSAVRGEGGAAASARRIGNIKRALTKELDNLDATPDKAYSQARALAGEKFSDEEALEGGFKFMSLGEFKNPEALKANLAEMGPSELHNFRIGAAQAIKDKISGLNVRSDATKKIFEIPALESKIRQAFGEPGLFRRYIAMLGREKEMFKTYAGTMKGSQTAERLAQDEAFAVDPGRAIGAVQDITSGSFPRMMRGLFQGAGDIKNKLTQGPEVTNEMARLLMGRNVDPLAGTFKAQALSGERQKKLAELLLRGGASQTGRVLALP